MSVKINTRVPDAMEIHFAEESPPEDQFPKFYFHTAEYVGVLRQAPKVTGNRPVMSSSQ